MFEKLSLPPSGELLDASLSAGGAFTIQSNNICLIGFIRSGIFFGVMINKAGKQFLTSVLCIPYTVFDQLTG